jgi:hypothetical protein
MKHHLDGSQHGRSVAGEHAELRDQGPAAELAHADKGQALVAVLSEASSVPRRHLGVQPRLGFEVRRHAPRPVGHRFAGPTAATQGERVESLAVVFVRGGQVLHCRAAGRLRFEHRQSHFILVFCVAFERRHVLFDGESQRVVLHERQAVCQHRPRERACFLTRLEPRLV